MDVEAMLELNLGILVHAAETAYVEGAPATYELLSRANELVRYFQTRDAAVSLEDELLAVEQYAFIQRKRHGARPEIAIQRPDSGLESSVSHLSLLSFVHHLYSQYIGCSEELISFRVQFRPAVEIVCEILVTTETGENYHEKHLRR